MMRAFSFISTRNLILAILIACITGLGTLGAASSALARSNVSFRSSKDVILRNGSYYGHSNSARTYNYRKNIFQIRNNQYRNQDDLNQYRYVKSRHKNRRRKGRNKKFRGLNNRQSRSAVSSGRAAELGKVVRRVRRQVPGQLLDARLMKNRQGRLTYRLKILSKNGVLRNVIADAYTGAILGIR